jgi:DNA ligase-1
MLAATADINNLDKLKFPVIASPKLDGIRCLIVNGKAVSRTFKPIPNHYVQSELYNLPEGLDGEIILPGKTFNEIQSAVMSFEGTPDFQYVVFDRYSELSYRDRLKLLPFKARRVIIHSNYYIESFVQLLDYETKCIQDRYEGICFRTPNSPYKCGRSTLREQYLVKLKRFQDDEAIVLNLTELMFNNNESEQDNFGLRTRSSQIANLLPSGKLGALQVQNSQRQVFEVGTGFTELERIKIWCNPKDYIGKTITYKFLKYGMKDLPRHPVFKGFRHDSTINIEDTRKLIEDHRAESLITCPEICWCWAVEQFILKEELKND